MLKVAALRNGFTCGKLFHQLEEMVSELLRLAVTCALWLMGNTCTFLLRTLTKALAITLSGSVELFLKPGNY